MSSPLRKLSLLLEVLLVTIGFRLLDKLSYFFFVGVHVLPNTSQPEITIQLVLLLSTVSTIVLFMVVGAIQRLRGEGLIDFGLGRVHFPSIRQTGTIILIAAVVQGLLGEGLDPLLEKLLDAPKTLPSVQGWPELVLSCFASLIGGGLREEFFYRGYLMKRWRELLPWNWGFYAAAVLQIGLFALSHFYQGPAGIVSTAIFGLLCTAVYVYTGSLWCAVIFHGFFDIFGFLLIYFGL